MHMVNHKKLYTETQLRDYFGFVMIRPNVPPLAFVYVLLFRNGKENNNNNG